MHGVRATDRVDTNFTETDVPHVARLGAAWMVAMLSRSSEGPYMPDMPMQPSTKGDMFGDLSQKMLTKTLRQLERDGLVTRRVHPVIPPHVDYTITPLGHDLGEAVCGIWEWVEANAEAMERARQSFTDRGQDAP